MAKRRKSESVVVDHNRPSYRKRWAGSGSNKYNGAYYYSIEIVKYFVPAIKTDRNWVTVNTLGDGVKDHSIVFIHNNLKPQRYEWLKGFDDMVLVCGVPSTVDKVKHLGKAIYLPLSIKISDVVKYRKDKRWRFCAFAGRAEKIRRGVLPSCCDYLIGMSRERLLEAMSTYHKVYAVGRTAIEAKALGCEIGVYDKRFPDPDFWKVVDSSEAIKILQKKLDEIDG